MEEKYQNQYMNDIVRQKCKEYYHNNKDSVKNTYLQTNYKITLEDYNLLLEKQNKKRVDSYQLFCDLDENRTRI